MAAANLFHWSAEGINGESWMELVREIAKKGGAEVVILENESRVQVFLDETHLDIKVKNGKARGSIVEGGGCWKAALLLNMLSRSFAITIVDESSESVTVRSLRKLTDLGFTEEMFDSFADSIGLINKNMAASSAFSRF